jgi:hypothetical protein
MTRRWWFWAALVVGWGVMIGAAVGALVDSRNANLPALVRYIVVFDVVHDAVVATLTVVLAWLVGRWLPAVARGPVRAALALTAILVVFSYPLVRRLGARASNDSALPLDYSRNLLVVLAIVWIGTAVVIGGRLLGRRVRRPPA